MCYRLSPAATWFSALCALGLAAAPAYAQQPASPSGGNIIRLDVLAPIGTNIGYNLFNDHGVVFPVLAAHERRLAPAWSLEAEVLLNGGNPTDRRTGLGIGARRYLRATGQLAGPYAKPLVSYRSLRTVDGYFGSSPVTTRAQRLGAGALVGWQFPLSTTRAHRFTIDLAVGVVHWGQLGTDEVEDRQQFYYNPQPRASLNGWMGDVRGALGYQF